MYSRPTTSSRFTKSPRKVPLRGLFKDGIWNCNCDPRFPATRFQVKKEGNNKGRWFYTCQQPKERGCSFFLWEDQAKAREQRAVLNNTRSEVDLMGTPTNAPQEKRTVGAHTAKSKNTAIDSSTSSEDEFGAFPLSNEEVSSVAKTAERAAKPPETPQKTVKNSTFITPSSKRNWDEADISTEDEDEFGDFPLSREEIASVVRNADTPRKTAKNNPFETPSGKRTMTAAELPTPSTGTSGGLKPRNLFGTPAVRLNGGMWDGNEPFARTPSAAPPTPSRFRDGDPEALVNEQSGFDITDEMMDILKDSKIDETTRNNVRDLLGRHALKISGIVRGRDISRIALKHKDTKIAELQQRIEAMETQREMDKIVIRHYKSDIAESAARKPRRGGGKT